MNMRKPPWLRVHYLPAGRIGEIKRILRGLSLHTVCEVAACPNIMECFDRKTATFMILGDVCTRNCMFCNISGGSPEPVDTQEPDHVAAAAAELGLGHVVVTSVTRDDLPDGGAAHFAEVIKKLLSLDVTVEVLIPDFMGNKDALLTVVKANPHIINHNVETVPSLYPAVRPKGVYKRSLNLLGSVKTHAAFSERPIRTKSGIMLGLGETIDEVKSVFSDLREANCDALTIGQYLAPSKKHHPVAEYVEPEVFESLKATALEMGFCHVAAGPLVRSSYHADEFAFR